MNIVDNFKDPLSSDKESDNESKKYQERVVGMKSESEKEENKRIRNRNTPSESRIPVSKKHYKENHYYEDFETIDWVKDISRDRIRHKSLHFGKRTILDHLRCFLDSGSGWFCVLAIGILTGLIAGIIDIGSTWLSDIRQGICWDAFWFNREQCCWSTGEENCRWYTWSELFLNKKPTSLHPDAYIIAYLFYCFWSLVFAGLCVLLVKNFAPYACGSGIPEIKTILSGFVIRGYLGKWTLLIKSVGMILGPSAGLSLGKEGPMVHMASCVGNILTNLFPKYGKNEAKKREILSASAAAGVAVAFGAPIGGVLFSLEEASYYFPMKTMFRSFFCAMISANVLRMMNPYGSDHLVLFYVDYKAQWHVAELIPFAFLGLLGGLFGFIFNKANLKVCRMRKTTWLGKYPVREVLFVTAITAIISFPHEYLRMNTSEMIKVMFSQCTSDSEYSICDYQKNLTDPIYKSIGNFPTGKRMTTAVWLLAIGAILKMFITIFTFGIKLPAGLFIPALAVGAMIGRIVGVEMEHLVLSHFENPLVNRMCKSSEACVNPGLYAMVGAAAFLGGVTRMTISLVVVMLELTGGLNYIIPLMVASMVSKWTGDRLTNGSIYEEHIKLNNYPYLGGHDEILNNLNAVDIMKPNLNSDENLLVLAEEGMKLGEVRDLILNSDVKGFPLVTSKTSRNLVGWVAKRDLILAIDKECSFESKIDLSSKVYFGDSNDDNGEFLEFDNNSEQKDQISLNLQHIVDLSPVTVTYSTPMETVVDFFKKLGLRQVVVTKNGLLLGIITKKDILNKIHNCNGTL